MPDFRDLFTPAQLADPSLFSSLQVPAHTLLLREGEVSRRLYFVRQGGLRAWLLHRGREVTMQFYFEGQIVSSLDSFLHQTPSELTLESIEPTDLWVMRQSVFTALLQNDSTFKDWFHQLVVRRMIQYARHLTTYLTHSPQQRYAALVAQQPHLLQRVPQHCLASYLGITAVSLSRIRGRKPPSERN